MACMSRTFVREVSRRLGIGSDQALATVPTGLSTRRSDDAEQEDGADAKKTARLILDVMRYGNAFTEYKLFF